VDGTLASLQRPGRAVTGIVWWALAAPLVLLPAKRCRRVLVLGLGAGSVGRAARAFAPEAEIVGVERECEVLRLARRHFGLDHLGVELRAEDARGYLARERRRFDLVVEDLFVGPPRTVHKPPWLLDEGYRAIRRLLAPGGLVTSNTIHEMPDVRRAMRAFPGRIVSLDVRGHWNRILLCGRDVPPPRELRRRLGAHVVAARILTGLALRTRG
jgi:spermidine synthase